MVHLDILFGDWKAVGKVYISQDSSIMYSMTKSSSNTKWVNLHFTGFGTFIVYCRTKTKSNSKWASVQITGFGTSIVYSSTQTSSNSQDHALEKVSIKQILAC